MATDSGQRRPSPHRIDADTYLKLMRHFQSAWDAPWSEDANQLEFLFRKLIGLINTPCPFNRELPAPFREVADKYRRRDKGTVAHFGYNENRRFFISDLHDYVRILTRSRPD